MRKAWCVLAVLLMGVGLSTAQIGVEEASEASLLAPVATTPDAPVKPRIWVDAGRERTASILKLLNERLLDDAEFEDTPLDEVAEHFSRQLNLTILIDAVALDDIGLSAQDPVSLGKLPGMPVGVALSFLLQPLDLTCVVVDGVLLITTEEEALTKLAVAVYPVADLLAYDEEFGPDYDSLTELITSTISADTWADNGGGEAEIYPYMQRGSLVVSQTMAVHEEVLQLLTTLRQVPVDPRGAITASPQEASVFAPKENKQRMGGGTFAMPRE